MLSLEWIITKHAKASLVHQFTIYEKTYQNSKHQMSPYYNVVWALTRLDHYLQHVNNAHSGAYPG